jgi:hypothetical protein
MNIGKSVALLMACAVAAAFASDVAAQANAEHHPAAVTVAKPNLPDMRLWSFGDCDEKFPYFNSDDHKECVRVVGSEEARDARAYRVCETSNARDPEEVTRCKAIYKANKDRSAQSGYVPDKGGQKQQAAPTADELKRIRAIASAAVENDKAVAREAAQTAAAARADSDAPTPTPEPEEPEGPSILVIVLSLLAAGGGTFAFLQRRKQADAFSAR